MTGRVQPSRAPRAGCRVPPPGAIAHLGGANWGGQRWRRTDGRFAERTTSAPVRATSSKRQLKGGAAGWVLLAGLGVAYVISGDFAGWNFGLAEGGWGGLLIATILMAIMYTCMVFGLAELSSAMPGGRRRLRLRAPRARPARRLRHRHGDPDRVRDRAGRDRGVHRRLRRVARTSSGSPPAGRSTSPATRSSSASTCTASARR